LLRIHIVTSALTFTSLRIVPSLRRIVLLLRLHISNYLTCVLFVTYTMFGILRHSDHASCNMVTHCILSDLFPRRHVGVNLSWCSCQVLRPLHGAISSILLIYVHADIQDLNSCLLLSAQLFWCTVFISRRVCKRRWVLHSYTSNCVGLFLIVYYGFPLNRAHYATIFRKRILKTDAVSFLPLVKALCGYFGRIREVIVWHYSLLNIDSILLCRMGSLASIGRLEQLYVLHLFIPRILLTFLYLTLVISSSADTFSPRLILIWWILFLGTNLSSRLTWFCISRC
jgi:hypothetical protein